MFWTDWNNVAPRIERATLAGAQRRTLYSVESTGYGGWPNGIACDHEMRRVFWVDGRDSIHTLTYEGEHYYELHSGANVRHPFAIALTHDSFFVTFWDDTHPRLMQVRSATGTSFYIREYVPTRTRTWTRTCPNELCIYPTWFLLEHIISCPYVLRVDEQV